MSGPWEDYTTKTGGMPWEDYSSVAPIEPPTDSLKTKPNYMTQSQWETYKKQREEFKKEAINAPSAIKTAMKKAAVGTGMGLGGVFGAAGGPAGILGGAMIGGAAGVYAGKLLGEDMVDTAALPERESLQGKTPMESLRLGIKPSNVLKRLPSEVEGLANMIPQVEQSVVTPALKTAYNYYTGKPYETEAEATRAGLTETGVGLAAPFGLAGTEAQQRAYEEMPVSSLGMLYGGTKGAISIAKGLKSATLQAIDKVPYFSAESLYSQALQPGSSTSVKGQKNRAKAIRTGLEKGVVISPDGNVVFGKGINDIINETFGEEGGLWQRGEQIVKSPEFANERIDLGRIQAGAEKSASELAAGNRQTARNAVEKVVTELMEDPSYDAKTNTISGEAGYRNKQKLYKTLNKAYEQDNLAGLKDAQMNIAAELREATNRAAQRIGMPELEQLLAEEGENLNYLKYAKRRMEQLTAKGPLHNSLGLIIDAPRYIMWRIIQSPGFKSRLAIAIKNARKNHVSAGELDTLVNEVQDQFKPQLFNPEVPGEPRSEFSRGAVETIPGRTGYEQPSLEEGGLPGYRTGTPEGYNPEVLPGRQSSAMDKLPGRANPIPSVEEGGYPMRPTQVLPEGATSDPAVIRAKMFESEGAGSPSEPTSRGGVGVTNPLEIKRQIQEMLDPKGPYQLLDVNSKRIINKMLAENPDLPKKLAVAGITASAYLMMDDEQRKSAGLPLLGVAGLLDPYSVMKKAGETSIFRRTVYAENN